MRFLKQRMPTHTVPEEPRRYRQRVFRWLYIAGIVALAIWLIDFTFSGLIRFRSGGLVVGDEAAIAPEFPATVRDLLVKRGDHVKRGQVVVIVSSQNVAEAITRFSAEIATRQARLADLRMRSAVVDRLLPLAENRQKIATAARQQLETVLKSGFVALNQRTAAIEFEYKSREDLETLRAEKSVIGGEISKLNAVIAKAEAALADLEKLYDDGRLRAPIAGVVSAIGAIRGAVVRPGDIIVEVSGPERHILAYVPSGGLFHLTVGEEVKISYGFRTMRGVISDVEPIAARLPREFQLAFRPAETQQVIRVDFAPGEVPPPLHTKVWLTGSLFGMGWIEQAWRDWRHQR
jgi:multidrug resistance efflux pump